MKWAHLPVAGGLYDQHPQLLEEWDIIFRERAIHEENERKKRERERQKGAKGKPGRRGVRGARGY